MDSQAFVYWLQGFMELTNPQELRQSQIEVIRDHLDLVLGKVTPDRDVYYVDLDPNPNPLKLKTDRSVYDPLAGFRTTTKEGLSLC